MRETVCRVAFALVLLLPGATQAIEVHLRDDSLLGPESAPPLGRIPVLFVHGHAIDFGSGADSATDDPADPNYKKNWWNALGDLPSFKQALDHAGNAGLDVEPYYIRLVDQARSITEDAREIGVAVDMIVQRHNPGYAVAAPVAPPPVQVVIVGYSKGTISTRQYLKSLTTEVGDPEQPPLPAPRPDYRPVSDFIAISPPNHGLATSLFASTTRTSVQQLYDGVAPASLTGPDCGDSYGNPLADDFIATLNGHSITDTQNAVSDAFASEAPGFRRDGQGPHAGTLYVSLYAAGNADMVGGDAASGDCRGRGVARNLAGNADGPIAVNVPIAGIGDDGQLLQSLRRLAVHQNTVHTHDVICKALFTVVHHRSPAGQTCAIVDNVPIVPPPARAAVMLALDMSGSMLAPACPGCGSRLDVLKDSVEIFASLWSMLGRADDRLGATYFRTTVDGFQLAGDALPVLGAPPPANVGALVADVHAQSTVSGNRTSMGGGLQRAIEALAALPPDAASRRHVVLFTDGMQNTNPMVLEVTAAPPRHEIADEPGRLSSGVVPSLPPVRLDALSGITVDTIGVGAGQAFVDLLGAIAAQTRRTCARHDRRRGPASVLRRGAGGVAAGLQPAARRVSPRCARHAGGARAVRGREGRVQVSLEGERAAWAQARHACVQGRHRRDRRRARRRRQLLPHLRLRFSVAAGSGGRHVGAARHGPTRHEVRGGRSGRRASASLPGAAGITG